VRIYFNKLILRRFEYRSILSPWWWRQHIPLKRRSTFN
jgi:hypothetical protein